MKILVTGGAGFIGSHVAKSLATRGDKVVIIDNFTDGLYDPSLKRSRVSQLLEPHNITVYEGDIRESDTLARMVKKEQFDQICHLAAWAGVTTSLKKPEEYETNNIQGTRNIFDLAKETSLKKVVYASSSSVYGANTKTPFAESDPVNQPVAPYALSKRANELQAFYYNHLYGLKSAGLRFFTVYGPWGRPDMALFKFTEKILKDEPIQVNNHGKMKRDFTYIDDIVSGVIAALDTDVNLEIFNLGGDQPVSLKHYIETIENTIGKKAIKEYLPMPLGEVLETSADITKAKKLLGFNPKTHVEEGIPKFWNWYKEYYGVQ